MFPRTEEHKVLRDPLHGYIHVDYQVIWDIINSRWFQRLRRIRQLGGAYMVYHTADHSRFGHSLGVYEIARRMVTEVPDLQSTLSEREQLTVMLAALMHDLGHGPFSHSFEDVLHENHETWTCRIIEQDPEIHGLLEKTAPGLAGEVADVIRHQSANPLLPQIVSSQLDADRMDYLLRDAYFTGTAYGEFDLERILRVLRVRESRIVIKESGIYAVENYIMARYHMYWQVYFHPTARSYENMMHLLFQRLRELGEQGRIPDTIPQLRKIAAGEKLSLEDYFWLDEDACSYAFALLEKAEDPVVRDLAGRLRNRRLFDFAEASPENIARVKALLAQRGLDPRYYLCRDDVHQSPYVPYTEGGEGAIWVYMHDKQVLELGSASNIVYSLIHGPQRSDDRIYFPKEIGL
jgi:HD superfamily phosphohydrolase